QILPGSAVFSFTDRCFSAWSSWRHARRAEARRKEEASMRNRYYFVVVLLALVLLRAHVHLLAQAKAPVAGESWALVGGTVYVSQTEPPNKDATIPIRPATMAAVGRRGPVRLPAGIQTLDCSGLTITAGFWNSHVHFGQRKWANFQTIPAAELSEQMVE